MSRMKSKDRLEKAVYEFLDWLEMKQPQLIDTFWRAAFVELLMNRYPTLRELHYSLMGGQSLHSARLWVPDPESDPNLCFMVES